MDLGWILNACLMILDACLMDFGWLFHGFWMDFDVFAFDGFWMAFGDFGLLVMGLLPRLFRGVSCSSVGLPPTRSKRQRKKPRQRWKPGRRGGFQSRGRGKRGEVVG